MNRPCFSLGVLLSSLTVCLLAVGSANSQTGLDLQTPACLMCPYAGHAFSPAGLTALAEPAEADAADLATAELPGATPSDALPLESQAPGDDVDYDLDYDYSDYDYSEYDYSEYDYSDYDKDYENFEDADYERLYQAIVPDAPAPVIEEASNHAAPVASDADDEFDNYDYADYFAEVYGGTDAAVIVHEDVDAFDDFSEEDFEVAATERDAADEEQEVDATIFDPRTNYDDTYDEVMAPTIEAPTSAVEDFRVTDHCFGGYADAYRSEYRCDLADAYQDHAYPSVDRDEAGLSAAAVPTEGAAEAASDAVDAEESDLLEAALLEADPTAEFSLSVEPYVAIVIDRVGTAWQRFSLDALVAKTFSEMAKLTDALADTEATPPVSVSIKDYVDCHVEARHCEANAWEIDCFAPWDGDQPVGSGVAPANLPLVEPTDAQDPIIDAAALDATKELVRDLRTRLNAARQSPPLR